MENMRILIVLNYVYGKGTGKNGVCKMYDFVLKSAIDTMVLARQKFINDEVANFKLETIGEKLGVQNTSAHDAFADVEETAELFRYFMTCMRNEGVGGITSIQRKEMAFQF